MSGPVWLDAGALRRALPMAAAIDALEQALRADDIPAPRCAPGCLPTAASC